MTSTTKRNDEKSEASYVANEVICWWLVSRQHVLTSLHVQSVSDLKHETWAVVENVKIYTEKVSKKL
jgi:hypothetical protein